MEKREMKFLGSFLLSCLAVFAPVKSVLLTALVLALVDLTLGVPAAIKRGEKITSKGLGRTILKLFVYDVAIMCGFLVQHYLIQDSIPLVNLIGGLIGVTELQSVLENLDSINGSPFFQTIIARLGSKSSKS